MIQDRKDFDRSLGIDEVIVALPVEAYDRFFELLTGLQDLPARIRMVPDHIKITHADHYRPISSTTHDVGRPTNDITMATEASSAAVAASGCNDVVPPKDVLESVDPRLAQSVHHVTSSVTVRNSAPEAPDAAHLQVLPPKPILGSLFNTQNDLARSVARHVGALKGQLSPKFRLLK